MDRDPAPPTPTHEPDANAAALTARTLSARFGPLLDAIPDAIVVADARGQIVLFNRQAERLFGYASGELLGRPVDILLPEAARSSHAARRVGYARAPRQRPMGGGFLLRGLHRDGSELPVEVSLSPLHDPELGALVLSAVRDVSEREWARAALAEQHAQLELASRAKERFFSHMSHELRTPLNAIIGFTSLLLMRLPGPLLAEQERQLQLVEDSAHHLLALIDEQLRVAADRASAHDG